MLAALADYDRTAETTKHHGRVFVRLAAKGQP
jgi:hypothetical protein